MPRMQQENMALDRPLYIIAAMAKEELAKVIYEGMQMNLSQMIISIGLIGSRLN